MTTLFDLIGAQWVLYELLHKMNFLPGHIPQSVTCLTTDLDLGLHLLEKRIINFWKKYAHSVLITLIRANCTKYKKYN